MPTDEPIDYQIGFSQFFDLKIDLSLKPLIPRVETEYWTDLAIKEIKKYVVDHKLTVVNVLDIFAGSGCIGLAVAKAVPEAHVTFSDSEEKFIEQVKINVKLNQLNPESFCFVVSDVFANIWPENKYDFILANPPYIPEGRKGELDKSVVDYEPHIALFSGSDGLDLCKQFLTTVQKSLQPDGQVWMEFDSGQKEQLEKLIPELFGRSQTSTTFHKDQYDRWRYVVIGG